MMQLRDKFLVMIGALFILLSFPAAAAGASPGCPPGFPERPIFSEHIEQEDIAANKIPFEDALRIGEALFVAKFNICDGQGRPATTGTGEGREPDEPGFTRVSAPDSNSCAGCHSDPSVGGAGDFVANVFVLAQRLDPVTDSISGEFSNSRNTLGMHGAGPIEMLAREMTAELQAIREEAIAAAAASNLPVSRPLFAKGVYFGSIIAHPDGSVDTSRVRGVDADLVIKPFHQAGAVVSLREFTVNAMNHHHGMQAEERFDLDPYKGIDFDQDGVARELTIGDITAVTLFQAALMTPGRLMPEKPQERAQAARGEQLFEAIGCTACHIPALPLESREFIEPNPYNPAGTWADVSLSVSFDMTAEGIGQRLEALPGGGAVVRAYTDLKRHDLCDDEGRFDAIRHFCNEQLAQNRPEQDGRPGIEFFLTRKLWDVGNTAPYGHAGDLTTITEAILMHGGEARPQRDLFAALASEDQAAVISFLQTLQILPEGDELVATVGEEKNFVAGLLLLGSAIALIVIGQRAQNPTSGGSSS